jgi:hypothetical protein
MDINRDIQCHFKKYVKYITPSGIIFYDHKEYDNHMKHYESEKKYEIVKDVNHQNGSHPFL